MTDKQIKECLDYILTNIQCMEFIVLPESEKGLICETLTDTLDLINRLQAENERLKKENEILSINSDTAFQDGLNEAQGLYAEQVKTEIKSEAIKEFAKRLKANITINNTNDGYLDYAVDYNCLMEDIDDLKKEMVGEE